MSQAMDEKCPYLELFWSAFSHIRTKYGEIIHISPYSFEMRENIDQNNSEYGHFLRSKIYWQKKKFKLLKHFYLVKKGLKT